MRYQLAPAMALALGMTALGSPVVAQAGRRMSVVVTDSNHVRLGDALVGIMPGGARARSDSAGIAALHVDGTGAMVLSVRRLGYVSRAVPVLIESGGLSSFTVIMASLPASLPGVRVEEAPMSPGLEEFERRRRRGTGRYLTEEDISRIHGSDLGTLITARIPGVRVSGPSTLTQLAYSTRGQNSFGGGCQIAVYVDGVREPGGNVAAVPLSLVAGIEYYTPGNVPVEYKVPASVSPAGARGGSAACGTILLWSR